MINKKKIITWILFFLVFFTAAQLLTKKKQPENKPQNAQQAVQITLSKTEFVVDEEVIVNIRNAGASAITIPSACPKNPLRVFAWIGERFEEKSSETKINCELVQPLTIAPNEEKPISFSFWNHSLFGAAGRYKVALKLGKNNYESQEFTLVEAGFWRKLFRTAFYQPLYNILVFLIKIAPAHDLGFAIILLTLLIRLVLLVPSQRAIVSQRRMQELQPKLEHIKKKYAGNQEKIAQETMGLWKEHKVNPFGSCLPILIQFPVLIALFYVIRNGLNPDNIFLLYEPLKNVDLTAIHTNFLGILELTRINAFVLPLIIGALQFLQLKLAMAKKKETGVETGGKGSEMETANKTMTYIMPVMIAIFTASVPAGVGLYWGISTAFALGQQVIANKNSKNQIPNSKQ